MKSFAGRRYQTGRCRGYIEALLPLEKDATAAQAKNTRRLREDIGRRYHDAPDLKGVGRMLTASSMQYRILPPTQTLCGGLQLHENLFIRTMDGNPMIDKAYQAGVNYFDTAYPYHDGQKRGCDGQKRFRVIRVILTIWRQSFRCGRFILLRMRSAFFRSS